MLILHFIQLIGNELDTANNCNNVVYRMQLYAPKIQDIGQKMPHKSFCLIFMPYHILKRYYTSNECSITQVLFLSQSARVIEFQ